MVIGVANAPAPAPGAVQADVEDPAETVVRPYQQGVLFLLLATLLRGERLLLADDVGQDRRPLLGLAHHAPVMTRHRRPAVQVLLPRSLRFQLQEVSVLARLGQRDREALRR